MAIRPTPARRLAGLTLSGAAHVVVCWVAAMPWGGRLTPTAEQSGRPTTIAVEVSHDELLEAAVGLPAGEALVDTGDGQPVTIAGVEFNLAKIGARRHLLFPFLTERLDFIDRIEARAAERRRRLTSPLAAAAAPSLRPPLVIGQSAVQRLIDRAWSRRERWRPFSELAAMATRYDASRGHMPAVLQAFTDQNLLQPYYDTSARDPRFWTMIGLAADHGSFLAFTRTFARAHPSSRSTTELLFLLEELAHGSRDTLLMLHATDPEAALHYTRNSSPEAFVLAVEIRAHYGEWLRAHQVDSPAAIGAAYDRIRLRLLAAIVASTPQGYRAADARYLAGVIAFERNDRGDAMRWWRDMRPQPGDSYAGAAADVLAAVGLPEPRRTAALVRVLGQEHGDWLEFSERRLRQFGHTFDTY